MFSLLLSEAYYFGANNRITKHLEGKAKEWDAFESNNFEELWNSLKNLKDHIHAQDCMHVRERSDKILNSYLWLSLKLYASLEKVKVKAEL